MYNGNNVIHNIQAPIGATVFQAVLTNAVWHDGIQGAKYICVHSGPKLQWGCAWVRAAKDTWVFRKLSLLSSSSWFPHSIMQPPVGLRSWVLLIMQCIQSWHWRCHLCVCLSVCMCFLGFLFACLLALFYSVCFSLFLPSLSYLLSFTSPLQFHFPFLPAPPPPNIHSSSFFLFRKGQASYGTSSCNMMKHFSY